MNQDNGALDFDVRLGMEDLRNQIETVKRQISGMSRHIAGEGDKMDQTFKKLGAAAAAYFSFEALKGFATQLVLVRGEFQQLEVAFNTMLGSKAKSDALMAQIVDTAAKTPFTLTQVASGAKQLLAYQVAAEDVNETVIRLGNISAGVSVPLDRLILAYGQVKAKGRLMGDDMRQFTEAGVPIIHELAKVMGVADNEIQKMVESGKIGFPEVQQVIKNLTDEGGMFFNLMEKQSKTITGQISNMQDAWDRMLNKVGQSNDGLISGIITGATSAIEHYEDILNVLMPLVATYGAYKAAIIATVAAQKAAALWDNVRLIAMFRKELGLATAAQQAFNTTAKMNPYVLGISLVVGLGVAIYELSDSLTAAQKAQERYNKSMEEANSKISSEKSTVTSLVSIINNENLSRDYRNQKLKELIALSPDHLNGLTLEKIKTTEGKTAIDEYVKSLEKKIKMEALEAEMKESDKRMQDAQAGKENLSWWDKTKAVITGPFKSDNLNQTAWEAAKDEMSRISAINNQEVIKAEKELHDKIKLQMASLMGNNKDGGKNAAKVIINAEYWEQEVKDAKDALDKLDTRSSTFAKDRAALQAKIIKGEAELKKIRGDKTKPKSEVKQFEDELNKKKMMYEAYYAYVQLLGEDVAKKQFEKLLKNGDSYTAYLEKKQGELTTKAGNGKLSDAEKENLFTVNRALNEAKGIKDPFSKFEESLSNINNEARTTAEYLEKIEKLRKDINSGQYKLNTEDQARALRMLDQNANNEKKKAFRSTFDSSIGYDEALNRVNSEFNAKIQMMAEAGLKENVETLKKQWKAAVNELNDSFIKDFDNKTKYFTNLYSSAAQMSKSSLEKSMADIKMLIDYITKEGKSLPAGISKDVADKLTLNEILPLYQQLNDVQAESEKRNDFPFATIINGIGDLRKANELYKKSLKATNAESKNILENQAEVARSKGMGKLAAGAAYASNMLMMVSDGLNRIAEASGSNSMKEMAGQFSAFANLTSATAQGFAAGGPWGALASGVTNILGQTFDAIAQDQAEQQEYLQSKIDFANKLRLMELQLKQEDYENIFGVSAIRKAKEAYKLAQDALEDYNAAVSKKMDKPGKEKEYNNLGAAIFSPVGLGLFGGGKSLTNEYKTLLAAYKKGYTELQGMAVKTMDRSGWANFWGKKDQYKALKDYAPQLWGADGVFSVEKAKTFLSVDKKVNEEQRKKIQNVIDLKEAYDANMEIVRQDIQDTFGSLGSAVTDSIVDAINNGTNAWDSFTKAGMSSLEALGKKIAYELFFADKFDKLKKQLEETYGSEASTEEIGKQQMKILQEFFGNIKADMTTAQEWMANWKNMSEEAGFSDVGSASTLAGSISATITEDTATLISGYINAIRINQLNSINIMNSMLMQLNIIAGNTSYNKFLESIDKSLAKLTVDNLRARG